MAITYVVSNLNGPFSVGDQSKITMGTLTLASTYVSGGFVINPDHLGFSHIQNVVMNANNAVPMFISAIGQIELYGGAASGVALTEITGGTDLTGMKLNFIAYGW